MIFLAAMCITFGAEVVAAPVVEAPAAPSIPSRQPVTAPSCIPAPIPYSGRPRCT